MIQEFVVVPSFYLQRRFSKSELKLQRLLNPSSDSPFCLWHRKPACGASPDFYGHGKNDRLLKIRCSPIKSGVSLFLSGDNQ